MLTYVSLFSGIGGFDLGFGRAGMKCAQQVEIDDSCNVVLERHWPRIARFRDIRDCGKRELSPVDLICGGFPCQDVSIAGKREGLAGRRSGLWFEFHRILEELRPQWVVIENVPGLLSSNGGRDFAVILRGLAELGYVGAWRVLDSKYFGVPQRRRRVFIVGHLGDGRGAEVLFDESSGAWDFEESTKKRPGVAATITERFGGRSNQWAPINEADNLILDGQNSTVSIDVSPTFLGSRQDTQHVPMVCNSLTARNERFDPSGETLICGTVTGKIARPDENCASARHLQVYCYNWQSAGDVRHNFGLPRLQASQVPAVGVRRLTPTECERLQGFPDRWTEGLADSTRYRLLGNAVTVNVAEWIGRRIVEVDSAC